MRILSLCVWQVLQRLGQGAQGSVFLAEGKLTPGHKSVLKKVRFVSAHYGCMWGEGHCPILKNKPIIVTKPVHLLTISILC